MSTETYGYDNMNRLSTVDRSEDGKRDAFDYNVLSEMNSAKYGLVNNANPNRTVSYDLDKSGNRNSVTDTGVVTNYTQSTTADALNQYSTVGGQTVGNGTDHQISSYQGVTYTYINGGRMTHAQNTGNTYDIKYDALGRAVSRTLNGAKTYYYYDGEKPINEMGATSASNVYGLGIDEIVIRYEPADAFYFYQDHEGSVTHVRDNAGAVEKYRYDAFGTPTIRAPAGALRAHSQVGSNGNRFLFTGREWNDTFDIYEYRARAYHPGLGRFMSEDPKGFDAGDYNLYRYCGNDPLDRTDPMGLEVVGNQTEVSSPIKPTIRDKVRETMELLGYSPIAIGRQTLRFEAAVHAVQISGKTYQQSSNREKLLQVMAEKAHDRMEQERGNPRVSEVSTYLSQKSNGAEDYLGHPLTLQNVRRDSLMGSDLFNKTLGEKDPSPSGYHVVAGIVAQRVYRANMSFRDQKAFHDLGYDGYTVVPGDYSHHGAFYIHPYHYPDAPAQLPGY